VPPKCVFDSPLPNGTQRITVPCCEVCRRAGQNDEALCRDLFISTRASEKNRKATNLAAKRNKSFENDWSQVERVVRHMSLVDVATPQGNVRDFAFDFDSPEMHRFILRMCRVLLHEETGSGHVQCRIVNWKVNPENDLREDLLAIAKGRLVSEEFAYAGVFLRGESKSYWLLNFYQSLEFFAVMETKWD
jgi:hypothetical protein